MSLPALVDLSEPHFSSSATESPVVDIVAVHGIHEGSIESWTDHETKVLWLRELFPYKTHRARVLLYSYNARTLASPTESTADRILPYATSLVAELFADRDFANAQKRPIIFICHGVGGLLVKRALVSSKSRRAKAVEHLRSIYISTYALIFLGTPHNGLSKQSLLISQQHEGFQPSHFMTSILRNSPTVNDLTDSFAPLMKQFSIYNFWEQLPTLSDDIKVYVVEEDSAAPPWNDVERCGIMATHDGMAKMRSRTDHGYRVIAEALERYIRAAPKLIQMRWQRDLKLLMTERNEEAEALLQPQLEYSASGNEQGQTSNEWFLVHRSPTNYFTGREKHAQLVKLRLNEAQTRIGNKGVKVFVVYGLGGSGKTQFCLKYAWDNRFGYWGVFWIDASNKDNLESGFASLGQQVGIGPNTVAAMHWLLKCSKSWLLILDNADDPDMDLSPYLPAGEKGHILVTTRNPNVIDHATAGELRFRGMEPEEAISLLLKSAASREQADSPNPQRRTLAQAIASELGYLALALTQAGTTIRRRIYTLERYLNYYLGHRKSMLSRHRIPDTEEATIITTWEIPFQRLMNHGSVEHKDAVDLLHIFAFMHFDSVPEEIFQRSWNVDETTPNQERVYPDILQPIWNEEAQARFRRAVGVLCDYSIIDYEPKKRSCSLHPVVHTWARGRLDETKQKDWLNCAMKILSQCISPHREASGRRFRRMLLPHMESCIRVLTLQCPSYPDSLARAIEIENFASVYAENGLWNTARSLQIKVVDYRIKRLGKRHRDTILAQRSLSYIYWNRFDIELAIKVQMKARETLFFSRPSLLYWIQWPPWKPDHVAYCVGLSDLTMTLWLAGQKEWSKYTGERAVTGLTKRLGPDDPETLTAMFNLARTYLHLNDYKRSHELLIWVLRRRRRLFGPNHPDTLMVRNELGMLFCARRKHLAVAERLISNVLRARRKILGEEHAYTLWSINDLSKVLCERGRPREAVKVLEEMLPVAVRTLGDDHVGLVMTRTNLARAYAACDELVKAEQLLSRLLTSMSPERPEWIHTKHGYIRIQIRRGLIEEAEKNCAELLDKVVKSKILPLSDSRTIAIAENLWKMYDAKGRSQDIAALKKMVPLLNENKLIGGEFDVYGVRRGSA